MTPATGKVSKLIDNKGFDITSASAGPGGIVYSQFGQLHVYDFASGTSHAVPVTVTGDLPQRRPHFVEGGQAASRTPPCRPTACAPRSRPTATSCRCRPSTAAWSTSRTALAPWTATRPGRRTASRSRISPIATASTTCTSAPRMAPAPRVASSSARTAPSTTACLVAGQPQAGVRRPETGLVVRGPGGAPRRNRSGSRATTSRAAAVRPRWSPDSRWITYAKVMPNMMRAIFVYSLADGSTHQVTDATSDCRYPAFDANGKYLYFTSSTDTALTLGMWEMSGMNRPVTRHVYATTLEPGTPRRCPPGPVSRNPAVPARARTRTPRARTRPRRSVTHRLRRPAVARRRAARQARQLRRA